MRVCFFCSMRILIPDAVCFTPHSWLDKYRRRSLSRLVYKYTPGMPAVGRLVFAYPHDSVLRSGDDSVASPKFPPRRLVFYKPQASLLPRTPVRANGLSASSAASFALVLASSSSGVLSSFGTCDLVVRVILPRGLVRSDFGIFFFILSEHHPVWTLEPATFLIIPPLSGL